VLSEIEVTQRMLVSLVKRIDVLEGQIAEQKLNAEGLHDLLGALGDLMFEFQRKLKL
jgi:hypothetical protein